ncbi:phytanoyl-CoA dioxygenase domain-containing protein 1-like [Physella acuta]|uniref:phytanoyl-CoA dioxygenase domain-containing protein 1-like n=1 Tax=Physella acuta TaxID=109671 RepID=UPI0027DC3F40|nr:phytanoyl-CoA dioxygenase domain-containing protein 1-like [Physella acuta]XP_059145484.1 phytanoyl-CoA dioxygenase domain-containing protein 1-like [Physella acuta]XP_059145485.1 phytanoyl-CoA dioxygenase domain-containing protein 1-like [Physella acuta]
MANTDEFIDWSTVQGPSGALYPPIQSKSEWQNYRLTEQELTTFERDGYLNHVRVLSDEQCDRILEDYKYFLDETQPHPNMDLMYEYHRNQTGDVNNVLMHALGHWRLTSLFHDLIYLPSIVVKASQLLVPGSEVKVRFWHDQLFAKPARHGGVVAWHQDYSYWTRTTPIQHLTVHIALEDQTEDNGTIQYIPGSHRWTRNGGPLPVLDFNFKDMEGIRTILTSEELSQFVPVPANLKKGEASFHHALSVHGSYENRSDTPRRTAVLNYFADGTLSNTDRELVKGSYIPKGEKMEGQLYPLVFDPDWSTAE